MLCSFTEDFYSLFIFWLALQARQNMAQPVEVLSDTTQQKKIQEKSIYWVFYIYCMCVSLNVVQLCTL